MKRKPVIFIIIFSMLMAIDYIYKLVHYDYYGTEYIVKYLLYESVVFLILMAIFLFIKLFRK